MEFLPLSVRLKDQPVLICGGGQVALPKLRVLLAAEARVTLVAEDILDDIKALLPADACCQRPVCDDDFRDKRLIVCAEQDLHHNRALQQRGQAWGIPVAVAQSAALSDVLFPALIDRSPLTVAINTDGKAPVLARRLRQQLEALLPSQTGRLVAFVAEHQQQVANVIADVDQRRHFWDQLLDGSLEEYLLSQRHQEAVALLQHALAEYGSADSHTGEVYLVGAGPGDPDLLTLRALRLLQKADVVLYDRLVGPGIVDLARRDAQRVYVGKARDRHTLPQENINDLLVHYARQGKRVCRLKGGDPFVFGRGGEEIDKIVDAQIPFQVVPGVTAACGCAAYAGIPLTHRDHAQSVRFVTGHRRDGSVDLDWPFLVNPRETVVFYMGLLGLAEICQQLIAHGRAPDTPVALVSRGTTAAQTVLTGTLTTLPNTIEENEVHAPTLIIVGGVVNLRHRYQWFVPSHDGETSPFQP